MDSNNTIQWVVTSSDKLLSYSDIHHCSDVVYWRGEDHSTEVGIRKFKIKSKLQNLT